MAQRGWKNPEGELGWERGAENEKEAAGWGGAAGSAWSAVALLQCPPGAHAVLMPKGLGPQRPGLGRTCQLVVEGFSNQTWQEGSKDCISASSVPGAHPFLLWLPPPSASRGVSCLTPLGAGYCPCLLMLTRQACVLPLGLPPYITLQPPATWPPAYPPAKGDTP